jgi:trans-aconitate 2-methyltransferase
MVAWDHAQYLKFADERTRPARELLARIPLDQAKTVVDLGCGPGNSTVLLQQRWPAARVLGVDDSKEMLQRAHADFPELDWLEQDARTFTPPEPLDVLFSNALLQWLPDHELIVPRLLRHVRPGGVLALQMPHNFEQPSHRLMRELPGRWLSRVQNSRALRPVGSAGFYYDLLATEAQVVDIWLTTYEHVLPSANAIVDWVKGTGLRPYLEALEPSERDEYLEAYTRAIDEAYPARIDGKRLFSFPRLFVIVVR